MTKTEKQVAAVFIALVALAVAAFLFLPDAAYSQQIRVCEKPGTDQQRESFIDSSQLDFYLGQGAIIGKCPKEEKKVTICHATSSETNPFVTITISESAVYGPGGHFNENGTTQAGHEQDYFGECKEPPVDPEDPPVDPEDPTPPGDRCPPGMTPTAGKDGEEGNDECEFPSTPETPTPEQPTTPEPPAPPEAPASPESPSPSAPEAPDAPSAETPDFLEELEADAKQQAKKNGAPSSSSSGSGSPTRATELPYTGLPLGLVALLGAALSGAGLWLRRHP